MKLDGALQFAAQGIDFFPAGLVVQTIQAAFGKFARIFRQRLPVALFFDIGNHAVACRFAEHDQVQQGIGTQTVRAVNGGAGAFARRIQAFYRFFEIVAFGHDNFAVIIGRDTAHHIVGGRHHRNRVFNRIDTSELNGNLADARQFFHDFFGTDMVDFQQHIVFIFAAAASFVNLHRHGAGNHVARSQILHCRCVTFHETFALRV